MDIPTEKLEIIRLLIESNDISIIEAIKNVFELHKKTVWSGLSPEQQEQIEFTILEANRGDQVEL